MRQAVAQAMGQARRLALLAHRDPDGDALGSLLGLAHLLRAAGKEVHVFTAGPIPEEYLFLPGLELLQGQLPARDWPDMAVLLDCHEPGRAGQEAASWLEAAADRTVVVDHHLGAAAFGRAAWVDPDFAATSEMLTLLAGDLGLELSPAAATCFFTGLSTDTGRFSYSNTQARTLSLGAQLVQAGARPWEITQQAYSTSLARLRLLASVVEGLSMLAGGRLALARVSQEDMNRLGVLPSDLDRIVEELRAIRGVEVAALLKELKDGGVKASLRGRGQVDLGSLAISLGGGGHKNAAGVRLEGSLDDAAEMLAMRLAAELGEAA